MASRVKSVPTGYETPTPYLICRNAAAAIEFYKKAFGATEIMRVGNEQFIGHAELKIGGGCIMLADEHPQMGAIGPQTIGGTAVKIHVYVPDVDALVQRAAAAGARVVRAPVDQFYGDRSCMIEDPFGHQWGFATHIEDLSPDEINRRAASLYSGN